MADQSIPLDVTVVTGMSGAGRSAAADVLEDLGFFVIDNLPPALIPKVAELGRGSERSSRFALVVDVRSGEFIDELESALQELRATGARTRVCFLDAGDDVLGQPEATAFLDELERLFRLLLPAFVREGKAYLSIGVGCTGGRHRSVVIASELAARLEPLGFSSRVHHRDVDRG